jgi:redox-sensitive bicupin YhaK (pirin superfamily)
MTAGSGIVHEEMPQSDSGIEGFQLWINLPQSEKMTPPRYRDIRATMIPEHTDAAGTIRVIAGTWNGLEGPITNPRVHPLYLDCTLTPDHERVITIPEDDTCFIYVTHGAVSISEHTYTEGSLILFDRDGESVTLSTTEHVARFLCIAGTPLNEPIAWHGPIVMNTDAEIREALADLRNGTFIKH